MLHLFFYISYIEHNSPEILPKYRNENQSTLFKNLMQLNQIIIVAIDYVNKYSEITIKCWFS